MEWPLSLCGYVFGVVDWCNVGDRRRTFVRSFLGHPRGNGSWYYFGENGRTISTLLMLYMNVRCPNLVKNLQHQFPATILLEPKVFMEYDSSIKSMEMFKFKWIVYDFVMVYVVSNLHGGRMILVVSECTLGFQGYSHISLVNDAFGNISIACEQRINSNIEYQIIYGASRKLWLIFNHNILCLPLSLPLSLPPFNALFIMTLLWLVHSIRKLILVSYQQTTCYPY